jgi:putative phosphoribosyl transferase
LLVDLLTPEEEETDIRMQKIQCKVPGLVLNKFNIKLLSRRLVAIIDWVISSSFPTTTPPLPTIKGVENHNNFIIGIFGASTGAAAALIAAAQRADIVTIFHHLEQKNSAYSCYHRLTRILDNLCHFNLCFLI